MTNKEFQATHTRAEYEAHRREYIELAYSNYEHKCDKCGSIHQLEIHHIDHDHSNNKVDNLVILCKSCHSSIHSKIRANTPEFIEKLINYNKTRVLSEDTLIRMSEAQKGKRHSEETRKRMSEARIGQDKRKNSGLKKGHKYNQVECPHCGKVGGGGNMKRYHFDNCKNKPEVAE